MKKLFFSCAMALGAVIGLEAAPAAADDTVSAADIQSLIRRLNALEAENKAQAARIAQLEAVQKDALGRAGAAEASAPLAADEGTTTNETGRIYTTATGKKYYLADATARIFEPLSESGLQITPYGYLVFEGVYSTRPLDCDWSADYVKPMAKANNTTLSMQDSILGIQFTTPEATAGWKFSGKAEFDLAGSNQNQYDFHWRHLYVNAEHETGWSILFGQTWHLWKMVTPSEIDGAWMENAGHPYRRSPQLRITKRWDWDDSSLEARVGIVKGGPGMGGDRDSDTVEDNTSSPWVLFEGAVVYDRNAPWQNTQDSLQDGRWLVGFGGQYGRDRSHRPSGYSASWQQGNDGTWGAGTGDVVYDGDEDDHDSMMGMFALSVPVWRFTLKGQIYGGENLGGVQAGCGQTVYYHNLYSAGNGVRTIGGFVDLGYKLTDKWSFAIGWGCDNPIDSDVEGNLEEWGILYNDRAYIDAFYSITANFRLGLEYARMLTRYYEGSGACGYNNSDYDADRIQFSAFYDF